MKVVYKLNDDEVALMKELLTKVHPLNAISGRMSDDAFNKKHKDAIASFKSVGLLKYVNKGSDSYWQYDLTCLGKVIQNCVLAGKDEYADIQ